MGGKAFIYKIVVIVTAICIILLTIPYWIHLNYASHEKDWVWVALDVISAVLMIVLGVIGIIGALKSGRILLLIYAIGMICMFIFILIQMIINLVNYRTCDNKDLIIFTCNYNEGSYLAPTILMLIITLVGGIAAILLRKQIVADDKPSGSYY